MRHVAGHAQGVDAAALEPDAEVGASEDARKALGHEVVARAVKSASTRGVDLADLGLAELRGFSPLIDADVSAVLTLEGSVNSRDHVGGTAPAQVRAAVLRHRARLDRDYA